MINVNDIPKIKSLFSAIFFYGFQHSYSYGAIEEMVGDSNIASSLENGDASFLYSSITEEIVSNIYNVSEESVDVLKTNPISLWLGDAYIDLFFHLHKPFSYLFLYLPLEKAISSFDVYHEMDPSKLLEYFLDASKKKTILNLLLKKRGLSVAKLSVLTGIKEATLQSYANSNDRAYEMKIDAAYRISSALRANPKVFLKEIDNYTESGMYEFDRYNPEYRRLLAYFLVSYFDKKIRDDGLDHCKAGELGDDKGVFATIWSKGSGGNALKETIKEYLWSHPKNPDLVLAYFDYHDACDESLCKDLASLEAGKIIFIARDSLYIIAGGKVSKKSITDALYRSAVRGPNPQ